MDKTTSIIITLVLAVSIGAVFLGSAIGNNINNNNSSNNKIPNNAVQNSEMKNGVQYITINAKGGYSPRVSTAVAGVPTKLIVKTQGTYDCSAALVIREVGFRKILNQTGEEIIDLGTPKEGQTIVGVCSMGMYSFNITFI